MFGCLGALLFYGDYSSPPAATVNTAGLDVGNNLSSSSGYSASVSDVLLLINDSWIVTIVKLLIILDLIFTLPLVLLVARRAIERESSLPQRLAAWYWLRFGVGTRPAYMQVDSGSVSQSDGASAPARTRAAPLHIYVHGDTGISRPVPAYVHLYVLRALRVALVLLAGGLAISVPDFGSLMTVIGGVTCVSVGYIIPPLLYIALWRVARIDANSGVTSIGFPSQNSARGAQLWDLSFSLVVSTLHVLCCNDLAAQHVHSALMHELRLQLNLLSLSQTKLLYMRNNRCFFLD